MTAATQWEYAECTFSGPSSDVTVKFYWGQGDGFVARAKGWFGDLLTEGASATNLLKFTANVQAPAVLGFMGTSGWELVAFSAAPDGGAQYVFKRPFGNTDIGKPV
jgi:hypothetical protein